MNRKQECPIHIRIIKHRKTAYIATGIMLREQYWNFDENLVKKTHPNSKRLNLHLQNLWVNYSNEVLKTEAEDLPVMGSRIKEVIEGNNKTSFFDVAKNLISKYLERGSVGTYQKAVSIINKLESYTSKKDIYFEEFDIKYLMNYESYLVKKLENGVNTVGKDFKFIRTVFKCRFRSMLTPHSVLC